MKEEVDLVGEGGRHDEAGVAHGAAKVDKTALGQQDDVLAVLQGEPVNLDRRNDFSGDIDDIDNNMFDEMILTSMTQCNAYLGLDVGLGPAVLLEPLDLEGEILKLTQELQSAAPHTGFNSFIVCTWISQSK